MDLKQVDDVLTSYLRLQTFPVAVRMCPSGEEIPGNARVPTRDMGTPVTVCQGLSIAQRYGWTLAISKPDSYCVFGSISVGFLPATEAYLDGTYAEQLSIEAKQTFQRTQQMLSRLEHGKYSHILMAPVGDAAFEPHLIVVSGNPAQIARLVQSALYETGGALSSTITAGYSCAIIPRTMLSDECQVIVPGRGARRVGLVQDTDLFLTMPLSKIEATIRNVPATHKAISSMRFPTWSYLEFAPHLPSAYLKLQELLEQV